MKDKGKITVEAKNLTKSFKVGTEKIDIIKGLNLAVHEGEFVSIMGPSGCGKSTLLYLLGGLDDPTQGEVIFNNKSYQAMKEKEISKLRMREMGFVFQFYNLVPNLSVEDNILLPLLLDGKNPKKYHQELDDILGVIQLGDKKKHTPRELSGGQQQRVAIARALLFNPKVILADEPIGNLDSKSGDEIMELFRTINKEFNKTIIQVTHSHEAAMFGQRLVSMKDGVIESDKMLSIS